MTGLEGWITTKEAANMTGYTTVYVRRLAREGRVDAQKAGRDWLLKRQSLLEYKARMDRLGPSKHSPWRKGRREEAT
jgi:excisionase family DNA binding protein